MRRGPLVLLLVASLWAGSVIAGVPGCHAWPDRTEVYPLQRASVEMLHRIGRWRLEPGEADAAREFLRSVLVDLGRDPDRYDLESTLGDWQRGEPFLRLRPMVPHLPTLGLYIAGRDARGCTLLEVTWEAGRPWEVPELITVGRAIWRRYEQRLREQREIVEDSWCPDLLPESCERARTFWQRMTASHVPDLFTYDVLERPGYCVIFMEPDPWQEGPLVGEDGPWVVLDGPFMYPTCVKKNAAGHCSTEVMEDAGPASGGDRGSESQGNRE